MGLPEIVAVPVMAEEEPAGFTFDPPREQMIHLKIPTNGILPVGQEEIAALLDSWGLPALPDDWSWNWLVERKGVYIGTFTKRSSKFYFVKHQVKLTLDQLTELGTLAAKHVARHNDWFFDFTQDFNWQKGPFCTEESCYWTYATPARFMLTDHGAWCMRFYASEQHENDNGNGRLWVVPQTTGSGKNILICYNGYCKIKQVGMFDLALVLSVYLGGLYYKRVRITNGQTSDGTLYINHQENWIGTARNYTAGWGAAVGDYSVLKELNSWEFGWKERWHRRCFHCLKLLNKMVWDDGSDGKALCQEHKYW
jgi:hypothetical protein